MQVSLSSAYVRTLERSAQPAGAARQASAPQRFADMPGAKAVDTATVPALSDLRWITEGLPQEMAQVDVEFTRKNLQGLQMFRGYMDKSEAHWTQKIELVESMMAKHGANPQFLAMIDAAEAALRGLATRIRDKDAEIQQVSAELEEKMRAPAYQEWLARQAAQSGDASDAQGAGASAADTVPARLSVVC